MRLRILVSLVLLFCLHHSYGQVPERIRTLNNEMEQAFNANNMDKVSSFYLDNAIISGGRINVTGRKDIDNYWLSMKDKSARWKLEIESIENYGEVVIQRGKSYLVFTSNGSERQSNVRFLLIWKKTGTSYRVLYDYFSML
jgi:ketosteroid isomerase-like protein